MRKTFAMLLLTLVLAMGAAGCSEDTGTGGNDAAPAGETVQITFGSYGSSSMPPARAKQKAGR